MTRKPLAIALVLLSIGAVPTLADPVALQDPDTSVYSGWNADWDPSGAVRDVRVIEVDRNASTVTLWIEKDFGPYEIVDDEVEFPVAPVSFTIDTDSGQPPVSQIILQGETIVNNSGASWSHFNWIIMQPDAADFLIAESGAWDVQPFAARLWRDAAGGAPQGNLARSLTAWDGSVPTGTTFAPTVDLVIDVTEQGRQSGFTLKQTVFPEPSCLAMLAVTVGSLLARRRRRRKPLS